MKRYLVLRAIELAEGESTLKGRYLLPGDEVELDEDTFARISQREPGALREMDPRTHKWEDVVE